jgi:uncharacterized protein
MSEVQSRVAWRHVQLLLPPSEAKASGGRGRALALREPHPLLGSQRARTAQALADLAKGPVGPAAKALQLPASAVDTALAANADVLNSPTMPALHRYRGVVYDGLAVDALDRPSARVAGRSCLIFSGLFGVVRGDEPIPDYRVPAKAVLPGLGIAGTAWRKVLDATMPALLGRGLIVDLRSSDYLAMWRPTTSIADRTVAVRVLSPLPRGGLGVVSYPSKFAKGQLAGALVRALAAGARPSAVDDLAAIWIEATDLEARVISPHQLELFTEVRARTS